VPFPLTRSVPVTSRTFRHVRPVYPTMPRTLTIGVWDLGALPAPMHPQVLPLSAAGRAAPDPAAPDLPRPDCRDGTSRILCDESGQLYAWEAERLRPLASHQLVRAVAATDEPGCRTLFPDPGCPIVVRWSEFRALLASQVANPERLRDAHRLRVYAQVYEVTRQQPMSELAHRILGDRSKVADLALLTDMLASLLGLQEQLPPRHHSVRGRPGADLMPADRIVRLKLTNDPTAARPSTEQPPEHSEPRGSDAPDQARRTGRTIPPALVKPWEFKASREEVLYQVGRTPGPVSIVRTWLDRIVARLGGRADRRRWEDLRSGKSLDEQLWSVRPPSGAFTDRGVRAWAARTLEAAGYDAGTMLFEWEIFWRRKLG